MTVFALTDDCGPHCGVDGFSGAPRVGHCKGCHARTCAGANYDRRAVYVKKVMNSVACTECSAQVQEPCVESLPPSGELTALDDVHDARMLAYESKVKK